MNWLKRYCDPVSRRSGSELPVSQAGGALVRHLRQRGAPLTAQKQKRGATHGDL